MPQFSLNNKTQVSKICNFMKKKHSKKDTSDFLFSIGIIDAYLHKYPNKSNVVMYILWLANVTETHPQKIEWIKQFLHLVNENNWKNNVFEKGSIVISYLHDENSESDDYSVPNKSEYDTTSEDDVDTVIDNTDESEENSDDETDIAFPELTDSQVEMILEDRLELTQNGKLQINLICDKLMSIINKKMIKKVYEKNPNKILYSLLHNSGNTTYEIFILQSFRFLILKSAFDYCMSKNYSQVRQSTIVYVCSHGELGTTIKLLTSYESAE